MTPSFPHRMVAVVARIVLATVEDLPAAVADIACLVAVPVSLWLLHRLIVRSAAWIGGHVAAHRKREEQRAFGEIVSYLGDVFPTDNPMRRLPPVLRQPALSPLRRAVRRRRMPGVRIPGRPRMRRHSPTSPSSDRRTR